MIISSLECFVLQIISALRKTQSEILLQPANSVHKFIPIFFLKAIVKTQFYSEVSEIHLLLYDGFNSKEKVLFWRPSSVWILNTMYIYKLDFCDFLHFRNSALWKFWADYAVKCFIVDCDSVVKKSLRHNRFWLFNFKGGRARENQSCTCI